VEAVVAIILEARSGRGTTEQQKNKSDGLLFAPPPPPAAVIPQYTVVQYKW